MNIRRFRRQQRIHKRVVLFFRHRAVQIVVTAVIAGLAEHLVHVQRFRRDNRGSRIVEIQRFQPRQTADGFAQRVAGQRPSRNNHRAIRDFRDFPADDLHQRMLPQTFRDMPGERLTINSQRTARRNARQIRRFHHQRVHQAHFFLQQADGVRQAIAAQRVRADQLRKQRAVMRRGHLLRLHFN